MLEERKGEWPGCPGTTKWMDFQVDTLLQAGCGDLRDHCRRQTDTAHWCVTSALHTGALTGLRGGPNTIMVPGTNHVRGPQRLYKPIPEPMQSSGCGSIDGFQDGGTFFTTFDSAIGSAT